MDWTIDYTESAGEDLAALDRAVTKRIIDYIDKRLANHPNPKILGKRLEGPWFEDLWRWRVGNYRIVGKIEEDLLYILIVGVGHRREIYRVR